ncbi:protein-L-isoaspartate O-methyltransferase [Acidiphilium sp. AL]|uniref:Protein-L-isoaspartate O-methyltransferase n=1 Tax=Acidiphilium iwatense TaxID=768198 RepID=A0ABS9DWK4_9PROT|nr:MULTISPECIES: protein-L-isoaspartate O-methyltransferase [Acidiphilium]MCF3947123.1 protein-L-isoaspartate O-methyltransferase [Acidiphilium iwatense]MCU4160606.1 protein-L-isoaspartate O-methyltransferase [Acidiphilium sp. AL]
MSGSHDRAELDAVRRDYAKRMLALAGVAGNSRLEDAFGAVPREDFLGPFPWRALAAGDLTNVYQDVVIPLDPERGVNNGSPVLHALWLDALAPKPGEAVAHLGAGTGYYTAILAKLVGPGGHVQAVEIDRRLAARARDNLAGFGNVTVIDGNAAEFPEAATDCIYVNFGVERPVARWIDRLAAGGRLVFPLGYLRYDPSPGITGGGFRIERRGDAFAASYLGPAYFVGDESAPEEPDAYRKRLRAAFNNGTAERIGSFRWKCAAPPERCWFGDDGWAFGYEPVAG